MKQLSLYGLFVFLCPSAINLIGQTDLAIKPFSVTFPQDGFLSVGGKATIRYEVEVAYEDCGPSTTYLYLELNNVFYANTALVGTHDLPSLKSDSIYTFETTFDLPTVLLNGNSHLRVELDGGKSIHETKEYNNDAASDLINIISPLSIVGSNCIKSEGVNKRKRI